jgi:hypothetical protein
MYTISRLRVKRKGCLKIGRTRVGGIPEVYVWMKRRALV